MKNRIANAVATLSVIVAGVKRFQEVLYNYSTASLVLADGIADGLLVCTPKIDKTVLDQTIVTRIEDKAISKLGQDSPEIFATIENSFQSSLSANKERLAKEEKELKDGEVGDRILILPKFSGQVYEWTAKQRIIAQGMAQEKSISKALDAVNAHHSALQSTVLSGVHRAGQAIGAAIAPVFQKKSVNQSTARGLYTSYAMGSYVVHEIFKATKKAAVFATSLAIVGLTGFSDGLASDEKVGVATSSIDTERSNDGVVEVLDKKSNSIKMGVVQEVMHTSFDDFETAFKASMKKRTRNDKMLKEGRITDFVMQNPVKAKKIISMRGRGGILNSGGGMIIKAGDVAISTVTAVNAVGLKLALRGMKRVGKNVQAFIGEVVPDRTPANATGSSIDKAK